MEDNILIDGISYDGLLLKAALAFTQGKGEYRLSLEEIQSLYRMAHEGKSATDINIATLQYIAGHYRLTEKAEKWFSEHIQPVENDSIEATIKKILDEYELFNLRLSIDSKIVQTYLSAGNARDWESVFRGAIEAYLEGGQGQLNLEAVVTRMEGMDDGLSDPKPLLKSYLDKGTLYLLSADETHDEKMPYDLPEWPDVAQNWIFVFRSSYFGPLEFFAFVHREKPIQYNRGQFSKKADLHLVINTVVKQFGVVFDLQLNIPSDELQLQMALQHHQNFGNALYSALFTEVFKEQNSSGSFDFIGQKPLDENDVDDNNSIQPYTKTRTLHLIPMEYRMQTDNGTAVFPIPASMSLNIAEHWYFGLELPGAPDNFVLIKTPRVTKWQHV
jgi:hypothetical protein